MDAEGWTIQRMEEGATVETYMRETLLQCRPHTVHVRIFSQIDFSLHDLQICRGLLQSSFRVMEYSVHDLHGLDHELPFAHEAWRAPHSDFL